MANPNQYSYRPQMSRNVTRKWAEARQVDYGGDDWGDDGYGPQEHYAEHQPLSHGQRSFTNPTLNTQRPMSYDHEAESRNFSAGPVPPPRPSQYDYAPPPTDQRFYGPSQPQQPAYSQPQYQPTRALPDQAARLLTDPSHRYDQRPDSRDSNSSATRLPPRKSSTGQNDFQDYPRSSSVPEPKYDEAGPAASVKPLPFIRPADIYKRMEEEREKERRSQDSSRPSLDSQGRDKDRDNLPLGPSDQSSQDQELNRKRKPSTTLGTVAERRSEYLDNLVESHSSNPSGQEELQHTPTQGQPKNLDTTMSYGPSPASPSSQYTDRPNSATTLESYLPSRETSQRETIQNPVPDTTPTRPTALPQINRFSTFGPDFLSSTSPVVSRQPEQPPLSPAPSKDISQSGLQQTRLQGYRSMVNDAFESENRTTAETPDTTNISLPRSNTTSTSDISPIIARSTHEHYNPPANILQPSEGADSQAFQPPKRANTDRRDSPSPARRPLSLVAPDTPEPLSAITSPDDHDAAQDTARQAQVVRPGLANLIHQRGPSRELLGKDATVPKQTTQSSITSDLSETSNHRTASEEWADWSAQKADAHARHAIPDSNPATPALSNSNLPSPAPPFESLDKTVHMPASNANESTEVGGPSALPSQRPLPQRDESFRPSLPGGWMSSTSIQKVDSPDLTTTAAARPAFVSSKLRTESTDSVPTAKAPRDANWRSQYEKSQYDSSYTGGAMAAATAAGTALAGIFNGPSLTLNRRRDSVSSIDDEDDGPTGLNRDASMKARDFAAVSQTPQISDQSASRDFAPTLDETTPRAKQSAFSKSEPDKPTLALPGQAAYSLKPESQAGDSPTKDSENWWSSDDEDMVRAPAPAPLRTQRLSTIEPSHATISPISRHADVDVNQLESDIVKSLTPKSSNLPNTRTPPTGRVSPLREYASNPVQPPFAAAAIAISPGRDHNALKEQNTFQPLSIPSSKIVPPTSPPNFNTSPIDLSTSLTRDVGTLGPTLSPKHSPSSLPPFSLSRPSDGSVTEAAMLPSFDAADANKISTPVSETTTVPSKSFAIHDGAPTHPMPTSNRAAFQKPSIDTASVSDNTYHASPIVAGLHGATSVNKAVTSPLEKARSHDSPQEHGPATPQKDLPKPNTAVNDSITRSVSSAQSEVSALTESSLPRSHNNSNTKHLSSISIYDPKRAYPVDKIAPDQINAMESSQQRINAYNQNRNEYVQPVGHLENWLSQMNTSEHADAFALKSATAEPYTSSEKLDKRDSSNPPSSMKMQEDGKRLLASASKYGQKAGLKAGVLGKGLFSKGKEKLRTVSAGQKNSSASRSLEHVPENRARSITPTSNPPQIPTPSTMTPFEENSLSAYFTGKDRSIDTRQPPSRAMSDPPFSPISEVSSNQLESQKSLERTISAISEEQSPQSTSTTRPRASTASTRRAATPTKSDKAIEGRYLTAPAAGPSDIGAPTDLLKADGQDHRRSNSSVSDVSSVSNAERRQSQIARTISPQTEPQSANTISSPPTRNISMHLPYQASQRAQHIPLRSTAISGSPEMAKEVEARQDRAAEPTLPAYEQVQSKLTRITPGTQIIPATQMQPTRDSIETNQGRPFSFVGNDSLLKTGYATNQSMDNPGVQTGSPGIRNKQEVPISSFQPQHTNRNSENPLPSARRNPEEYAAHAGRTPEEFAKLRQHAPTIQTQPQIQNGFRIPGPYGQELRSPKPKSSSPVSEQVHPTVNVPVQNSTHITNPPLVNAFPTPDQQGSDRLQDESFHDNSGQSRYNQHGQYQQIAYQADNLQQGVYPQNYSHGEFPQGSQIQPDLDSGVRRQRSLASSLAEHEREHREERQRTPTRSSKFSSIFRPRSRSRSRRLTKEPRGQQQQHNEERYGSGNRNSLMQTHSQGHVPQGRYSGQYDELTNHHSQGSAQPGAGIRRLSKDVFANAQYTQQAPRHPSYGPQQHQSQPPPTSGNKKKRFSGLFGKSSKNEQVPARSQTMPMNQGQYQQQPYPPQQQMYGSQGLQSQTASFQERRPQSVQAQPHTMYAQSQDHPSTRQQAPPEQFQGVRPPMQGYYGSQSDMNRGVNQPQGNHNAQGIQSPDYPNQYGHPQQPTYQQDSRGVQNSQNVLTEQQRPELSRISTGERTSLSVMQNSSQPPYDSHVQYPQSTSVPSYVAQVAQQMQIQSSGPSTTAEQASHQPPSTRANKDISHGSNYMPRLNTLNSGSSANPPVPIKVQTGSPTPLSGDRNDPGSTTRITPRVAALHTRSRSPKLGRRNSADLNEEFSTMRKNDSPVAGLGMFSNKKVSPTGGVPRHEHEQEKPWTIGLPGTTEEHRSVVRDDDPGSATSAKAREMRRMLLERSPVDPKVTVEQQEKHQGQTVADRFMGVQASVGQNKMTSPIASATPFIDPASPNMTPASTVLISKNPSLRGREPINRSANSTPINSHATPAKPSGSAQQMVNASKMDNRVNEVNRFASLRNQTTLPADRFDNQSHRGTPPVPQNAPPPPPLSNPTTTLPPLSAFTEVSSRPQTNIPPQPQVEARSQSYIPSPPVPAAQVSNPSQPWVRSENETQAQIQSLSSQQQSKLSAPPPPREPSISPPPPPDSKATLPKTTNKAGNAKATPAQPVSPSTRSKYRGGELSRGASRGAGAGGEIHEMPGSRPDGYESEEEVLMSATAYPGQEWMPVFERWED